MVEDLEVEVNRKEYSLLIYFVTNNNKVLSREQILYKVWGYDFDGDIRTIDTHIKTLRSKLLNCGSYIKTVRGSGYMFEVDKDMKTIKTKIFLIFTIFMIFVVVCGIVLNSIFLESYYIYKNKGSIYINK